jgi:hypothetical protein
MRPQALLLGVAVLFGGCDAPAPSAPTRATVSVEQFRTLHWIAGRWRGTDTSTGGSFYESYRVVDDSTLETMTWTDSTFTTAADTSVKQLRGGHVMSGTQYVAVSWDSTTVRFESATPGGSNYVWTKENADRWTAVLNWPGRSRAYRMTRVPAP